MEKMELLLAKFQEKQKLKTSFSKNRKNLEMLNTELTRKTYETMQILDALIANPNKAKMGAVEVLPLLWVLIFLLADESGAIQLQWQVLCTSLAYASAASSFSPAYFHGGISFSDLVSACALPYI